MTNETTPLPTGAFSFSGKYFTGQTSTAGRYTFRIIGSSSGQCDASGLYTLTVEDLAEPNLIVRPAFTTVGSSPFFMQETSQSNGAITYSINTSTNSVPSTCVKVGPNGFVSNITCSDSIPILVKQAATAKYKATQIETYIKVSPNPATLLKLTTTGVILNEGETQLKYFTNSNALSTDIQFVQLNNLDIAEIKPDGSITPYKQGTVDIEIRIPATSQYDALTRTATITVYAETQKPIVVNDTIVITINQDTIVNILDNDYGVTRAIAPAYTDIDMENTGVQNKFFLLSVGNFLIDLDGNLQFQPFDGFIGEGKIAYTVTDSAGVKSDIGYVYIKVVPLKITPPLKANEVMTPNNDGFNDGLVIAYAYLDENNSITIMDEVGNLVYETSNYQNDWRGTNSKGKSVEAGIYYYVYQEKVSGRGLQQYIQILK